ncbi:TolC family protein [Methylococcus sp. EFPC2]|uniref:TolC family protein n=1 Tax=Methylococcus sp. EFPC2 TaxID=2812648 RepID=UPI001F07A24E|nr:TolC family protein [Methylococcus sp. EFPC2]
MAACLVVFSCGASAVEPVLSPEKAVALALEGNPGLAQIKARAEAMAAVPSQEGSLPDPTLNFDTLNLPVGDGLSLRKEDMTMLELGVSQAIPFPGKLALKEQAARFEAEAAADTVEEARLRLARDVKMRWWQLVSLRRSFAIIAEAERLLKQLVEIADSKYRVGEGAQQDVLAARLELAKLIQQRAQHVGLHVSEIARLNALLNRSADSAIPLPDEVETALPDIRSDADLLAWAEQSRPLLAQRKHAIDAAQSRLDLAKKDYYPDFTVGAGYAFRQDTPDGQNRRDFANFRLSMNLPVFADSKQSKAVDQRNSELLKERYALDEAERKIQTEIASALAVYRGNREQFRLFEDSLVPLARETVTSALTAYQVGKTDFLNVVRAENAWFDYQMQYWQALADAHQALARLVAAVGKEAL